MREAAKATRPVIEDVKHEEFQSFLNDMAQKTSGRTANKKREQCFALVRWLRGQKKIDVIPFEHVPKVDELPNERIPFRPEELPAYLNALSPHARLFAVMLALTGERVDTLGGLKRSDVEDALLWLELKKRKKSTKPRKRAIRITPAIRLVLESASSLKPSRKVECAAPQYVFFNERGNRWKDTAFSSHCTKRWKNTGLEHRVPHELRHGFGTLAARCGFSRDMIRAAMGHLSSSTADQYIRNVADEGMTLEVHSTLHKVFLNYIGHIIGATPSLEVGHEVECPHCKKKFHYRPDEPSVGATVPA